MLEVLTMFVMFYVAIGGAAIIAVPLALLLAKATRREKDDD